MEIFYFILDPFLCTSEYRTPRTVALTFTIYSTFK